MNLLKALARTIPSYGTTLPVIQNNAPTFFGKGIALYPADSGERFITKGWNKNDGVYSIVSKNAEKASQVRLYHVKIKRNERKTRLEYELLSKGSINDKVIKELNRMRKAMIEENVVDSELSRLLDKPNRNQTQSEWIEQLFGLRELQGEGNIWISRDDIKGKPIELMVIPKSQLALVGDTNDPWNILGYNFNVNGRVYNWEKENVIMWRYTNNVAISSTFEHLRGYAPLTPAMVLIQGMNEGDVAIATSNKNVGANGFAFRKDLHQQTPEQAMFIRKQFDDIINNSEMAGKIGVMNGEWDYKNIGSTIADQKLLDQYGWGFKRLCRVFKTPAQIFDEGNGTWDNQKQAFRHWIYAKIAPNMYNFRKLLSDKLIPAFNLNPELDMIDCDIMSLPEMSQDLKELVDAVKEAWWLTPNQKLSATGYEESTDPNMNKIYVASSLSTLEQVNQDLGSDLDEDVNLLNTDKNDL